MAVAVTAAPKFSFFLNTKQLDQQLEKLVESGAIIALVFNDARSEDGEYYFKYVDQGRGPVRPVSAKALHWIDPKTGKDVFAKYAKGVPPRHIISRALAVVRQQDVHLPPGSISREGVANFVNAVALLAIEEMMAITPVETGKLKNSYRLEKAVGET